MHPVLDQVSQIETRPVSWLWPERIAKGRITLLAGDPGLGKTWLTLDIAARVSAGRAWPTGEPQEPGRVLIASSEDSIADTIKPRLESLGADTKLIYSLQITRAEDGYERPIAFEDREAWDEAMEWAGASLLIIDPVSAYFRSGPTTSDSYVRSTLMPLAMAAERRGCAVLLTAHLNKATDMATSYRASGSIQFVGASRMVYTLARDARNPGRVLAACTKNNLGQSNWGMSYWIDMEQDPPIQWEPELVEASELEDQLAFVRETEEVREIVGWLKSKLFSKSGVPVDIIRKEVRGAGWQWQNAMQAKRIIGVRAYQISDGEWYWENPELDPTMGRGWRNE